MKYIAILRGINSSSNTKVSMSELKVCLKAQGLKNVSTTANSGNVLFESDEKDETKLVSMCEQAIEKRFGFPAFAAVLSTEDFIATIDHAPSWWANDLQNSRHDALFVIPPAHPDEIIKEIDTTNEADEKIASYGSVIFWSVSMKAYSRSQVVKMIITNAAAYEKISLRSSTTTKKLYKLIKTG